MSRFADEELDRAIVAAEIFGVQPAQERPDKARGVLRRHHVCGVAAKMTSIQVMTGIQYLTKWRSFMFNRGATFVSAPGIDKAFAPRGPVAISDRAPTLPADAKVRPSHSHSH